MKIEKIAELLDAKIHCGGQYVKNEVYSACGADLMSDVLAYVKDQAVLLTGLINPQVIRTAEMMDIKCVVFVREKQPDEAVLELARKTQIVVMSTKYKMYPACGLLYKNGLVSRE